MHQQHHGTQSPSSASSSSPLLSASAADTTSPSAATAAASNNNNTQHHHHHDTSAAHIAQLLAEFHSPHTDNARKRICDAQLSRLQAAPDAWPRALAALATSPEADLYAWHFNATTVQLAITRRWTPAAQAAQLPAAQRQQLREGVWQAFMSQLGTRPVRLKRDKLAQLIALMGKQDYPAEHGTYMAHVLQLLRQNFELGLALLRATSDEVCSTRDDVTAQRRAEFHAALTASVPEVVDVLVGYLAGMEQRIGSAQQESEFERTGTGDPLQRELQQQQQLGTELGCFSIPRDEVEMRAAAIELLACVQNLFAWISPAHHLTESLINALFALAFYRSVASDVCSAALTTITELFYRQVAVPQMGLITGNLHRLLVRQQQQLRSAHEFYQDKLTELLCQFSLQHWSEWTTKAEARRNSGKFSTTAGTEAAAGGDDDSEVTAVLNALYEFTFAAYGPLAFTERLAIWCPLVRGLSASGEQAAEIVQLLVSGILRRFQFRFDQDAELDTLDNDGGVDEDDEDDEREQEEEEEESEWQQYLRQCIETIVLIGERRPVPVFEQVFNDWQRPFEMFMSLQKSDGGDARNEVMQTLGDYQRCNLLRCVTKDLASLAQTLGSLIPVLHNHPAVELPANVHLLAEQLVSAVAFLAPNRLHDFNSRDAALPQIHADFIELHAQVLLALRNFLGWSPALSSEAVLKPLIENVARTLLPAIVFATAPGTQIGAVGATYDREPRMIVLAASQLLLSITSVLRPKYAFECPAMQQLFQAGPQLAHLHRPGAIVVQQSLVASLVVPWSLGVLSTVPQSDEQDMEKRGILLQKYVDSLAADLMALDHTSTGGQQDKIIKVVAATLPQLAAVLEYFAEHQTHSKQMLLAAYRPCIGRAIVLFGSFGADSADVAEHVLRLCLAAVRTLQQQLGGAYLKEMLGIFLEASTRGQMSVARLRTMDRLLRMLLLVVEQPGSTGLALLPAVLTVALDLVQPVLEQQQQQHLQEQQQQQRNGNVVDLSDVTMSLFTLFDGILHHRWQYFYKSQVRRGFSPAAAADPSDASSDPAEVPPPQHDDQLLAMLTAYGHALCACPHDQPLIAFLLRSLHSLHERQHLFARPLFRDRLLQSFHCALITALIASPVGALQADGMLSVLYTMGRVSVQQLHGSFVQLGYAADSAAVEQVCLAGDLPTFSQRMAALIQDTRCTQMTQRAAQEAAAAAGAVVQQ